MTARPFGQPLGPPTPEARALHSAFHPTPSWKSPLGALQTQARCPLDWQWPNRLISPPGHTDSDSDSPGVGGRNPLERSGWWWELEGPGEPTGVARPTPSSPRRVRAATLAGSKALGLVSFPCFLISLAEKISQEPSLSPCSMWEGWLRPWLSKAGGQCDQEV